MALSGSFGTNVGSYWRLQGEWSATQNAAANTSTITLKVYWMATQSGYGAIYSSSSKSGSSYIEGGGTATFTATAGLSNGQKKLLDTHTRTVTHNADGTLPDVDMSISFTPDVTLSGSNPGTVTAAADFALNTIPRESTLAADPTWRAGEVLQLSVNRSSSSFTHEASIYALNRDGTYGSAIKTVTLDTYQNVGFSESEYTYIFTKLDGRSSMSSRVILKTYNGSTFIGQTERDGILMAPLASHVTTGFDAYQYITEEIDFGITRQFSFLTHTVRIKLGSYTKTFTGVTTGIAWTPTQAERDLLAAQMPNEMEKWGTIEVDTFYNGIQVRTTETTSLKLFIYGYAPVFNGVVTYRDIGATTSSLTGNNQYIISNKSSVTATLPGTSKAVAQGGATIVEYRFKLAGKTFTRAYTTSDISVSIGTIAASTNQTLVVEAVDSRGQISTISKIVTVIPYSKPTASLVAARINGFEASTSVDVTGRYSLLNINGTYKNEITTVRYRTKPKTSSTWSGYTTMSVGTTLGNYNTADVTLNLDSTQAYDIQVDVIDMLDTTTVTKTVAIGRPIWFIDDNLSSIGFNDFPKKANEFLLKGDLTGVNAIYFDDPTNGYGEGMYFPRSTTPAGSTTPSDYDKFHMYNGGLYMNSSMVMDEYGMRYPASKREANGANILTQRVSNGHTDYMMIQNVSGTITIASGSGILDVTWATSFTETPEWVIAVTANSNSSHVVLGTSNITSTGCRVTGQRGASTTSANFSTNVVVIACGRRP